MAIRIKTEKDIAILREGGKRHAYIMAELIRAVHPGVSTLALEELAMKLIRESGDKAAFLNYKPYGADRPYPAGLCVSINDAVVHGIPNEQPKILKEGDVVSLDMGLVHKGMITDMAVTIPVGVIDEKAKKLLEVTEKGLSAGIKVVKVGGTTGDIGAAIETHANKAGFGIVRELAGHGVGYAVHEDPYVPNYGKKGEGTKLRAGMVIAIEPMFNEGGDDVVLGEDGYTYTTRDGSRSAHFEHTVLITEKGAEILTII